MTKDIPRKAVVATLSHTERAGLEQLAQEYDRSLSGELRRAVRFYVSNFEQADRVLRGRAVEADIDERGEDTLRASPPAEPPRRRVLRGEAG